MLDARPEFTDIIEQVARAGDTYIITKSGKPKAKIVPLTAEDLKNLEKENEFN